MTIHHPAIATPTPVPGRGLTFARFIKALHAGQGTTEAAEAFASSQRWNDRETVVSSLKSVIEPLQIDFGVGFSGQRGGVFTDFAEFLRPLSIVGRLALLQQVPFATRLITGIGGARASWVAEGEPIPATYSEFADIDPLPVRKIGTIAVATKELIRNSTAKADRIIANDVALAVGEQLDRSFVDPSYGAVADARPASITFGAPSFESSGSTVDAIDADLERLIKTLIDAGMPLLTATWLLHPSTATSLALKRDSSGALAYPGMTALGGTLAGLPAITSTAMTAAGSPSERNIVLLEQAEISVADESGSEIEISDRVALQFDDAPASSAQPLRSLWQGGMVAIKCVRYLNWQARRDGVAVVLRSVNY